MANIPVLDLMLLETRDTKTLGIADISIYPTTFTVSNPTLEITPPNFSKVAVTFVPSSANIFRAEDLNINCGDCEPLPDGIYKLKYSISPSSVYFIEKNFLRVDSIRCKQMNAFLKTDIECGCSPSENKKVKEKLRTVDMFIEGSIAAANNCDAVLSAKLYNKAWEILEDLSNCGCK